MCVFSSVCVCVCTREERECFFVCVHIGRGKDANYNEAATLTYAIFVLEKE